MEQQCNYKSLISKGFIFYITSIDKKFKKHKTEVYNIDKKYESKNKIYKSCSNFPHFPEIISSFLEQKLPQIMNNFN